MKPIVRWTVTALCILTTGHWSSAHELQVGRNNSNQVAMNILGGQPFEIRESELPGFDGFAAVDPGFVSLLEDDPNTGLFLLPQTSFIKFTLLGIDPGLQIWNDTGTAPMNVGETYTVGIPLFHTHPVWHIPSGAPGNVYAAQIQLFDQSGILSPGPIYTLTFAAVPEPATISLVMLAALTAAYRQRRQRLAPSSL